MPADSLLLGTVVSTLEGHPSVMLQDSRHNYWFGGTDNGVYQYRNPQPGQDASLILYTTEDGLCSNQVIGIQEDQEGNIYFDTSDGVSKFDGQTFTSLKMAPSPAANNKWILQPTDLWFRMGWQQEGPYRYDGQYLYPLQFPKPEQADTFYAHYPQASFSPYGIYSMYQDSQGAMWFGTAALGVCRYDGNTVSWLYEDQMTTMPGGGALGIRSIQEDRSGRFWFTNSRYRYRMLPGSIKRNGSHYLVYEQEAGIPYIKQNGQTEFPYFMSVTSDQDGSLWMAGEGVWHQVDDTLQYYPVLDDGEAVFVFSIYCDKQNQIWLLTLQAGIYRFGAEGFEQFAPSHS